MRRWRMAVVAMCVAAASAARPEEPAKDAAWWARQAEQSYREKNYEASWTAFGKALEMAPGHPRLLYNAAAAGALAGRRDPSLTMLERLAAMQLAYDLEQDADFASLREDPRFRQVVQRMGALRTPRGGGAIAFRLSEPDWIPEGIAHDPVTGDFFVGSVRRRAIARVSAAGSQSVFVAGGRDGLGSVLGLAVDPARRVLHACSSALPQMSGGTAKEPPRGSVFTLDLKDGRLVARRDIAAGAEGHDCNDLAVSPSGDLYISDSRKGTLLRAPAPGGALDTFLPEGTLRSPQGIAFTPDGSHLYVADYARGVFRVDLAARTAAEVPVPDDVTTRGVDALLWHDGTLIAIQNGVAPQRITRFVLDPAGVRILRQEILGMNHPQWDEPTLGVIVAGALHYVANSHWGKFGPDGTTLPDGLEPPVILRLPLTPPAPAAH